MLLLPLPAGGDDRWCMRGGCVAAVYKENRGFNRSGVGWSFVKALIAGACADAALRLVQGAFSCAF